MRKTTFRTGFVAMSLAALAFATPAFAEEVAAAQEEAAAEEEEASGPIDVEFAVDAVSDYRFRGISLTDIGPAIQPSITVSHESGLYVSAWASNITDNGGDDIELDLVAGFSVEAGAVTFDANATYYVYPGVSGFNYVEFITRTSTAVGGGEIGLTLAYAPSQANIGSVDNFYVGIDGSYPIGGTPLSITGSFGFEDGAFGDNKKDWSLGLSAEVGSFTLGVAYIDTANAFGFGNIADAGVVASVGFTF